MANNELNEKEQAAVMRAQADQNAFEAWAQGEGVHIELAAMDECEDGRFPATYHCRETETAWRAWANKQAAPAQAEPGGALPVSPVSWRERTEARAACLPVLVAMQEEITELRAYAKQAIEARGALSDAEIAKIHSEVREAWLSQRTTFPSKDMLFARAIEARILGQQGGGDAARRAEFQERMRLFQIGKCLEDEEIDDQQQYRIGAELIALSGICTSCYGGGQDGDAPDANGEGGWVGLCGQCDGTGLAAIKAQAGEGVCDA